MNEQEAFQHCFYKARMLTLWATEEMRCRYVACTVNQRYEEVKAEYAEK